MCLMGQEGLRLRLFWGGSDALMMRARRGAARADQPLSSSRGILLQSALVKIIANVVGDVDFLDCSQLSSSNLICCLLCVVSACGGRVWTQE